VSSRLLRDIAVFMAYELWESIYARRDR